MLTYATQGGFNYGDVMDMLRVDRDWYLERLANQKQEERREVESIRSRRAPRRK